MGDRNGPDGDRLTTALSLYCIDDVPATTNTTGSNIGAPLDRVEWVDSIRWRHRNTPEHPPLPDTRCGA